MLTDILTPSHIQESVHFHQEIVDNSLKLELYLTCPFKISYLQFLLVFVFASVCLSPCLSACI